MSNIEEDIKILNNLKGYLNKLIYEGQHKIFYNDLGWDEKTIDCINAIEIILAEREQEDKRIKELEEERQIVGMPVRNKRDGKIGIVLHQWENGSIAVLENISPRVINTHDSFDTLEIITDEVKHVKTKDDSIPVQKVKDLKKSIILEPTIVGGRRNSKTLEYGIKLGKIKACEELLEDK